MRKIFYFILSLSLLFSLELFSFKQKDQQTEFDSFLYRAPYTRVVRTISKLEEISGKIPNYNEYQRMLQQLGPNWNVFIDERTGRISLLEGGAIPWMPGPANFLVETCDLSCLETKAREFLKNYKNVFQIENFDLVLDKEGSIYIGNSIHTLRFQAYYKGIKIEGGSVYFLINNGNLINLSLQNLGNISIDTNPKFSSSDAWQILNSYLSGILSPKDEVIERGKLLIIPITPKGMNPDIFNATFGSGIDYLLVWELIFTRPGVMGTWRARIDAITGEVVEFLDINKYGLIKGGVYKTDKNPVQVEEVMPFPYCDYGTNLYTDVSGSFPGNTGTSTMTGRTGSAGLVGSVKINDNCGTISLNSDAQGIINFGTSSGTDCTTPGFGGAGNTHSARTQYWNVAQIKMKAYTYLPANSWLQGRLTDNVNINQACNAYWNGTSVNFFKSGSYYGYTCGNTGEIPGVSLHEWGHGMDDYDGSGGDSPPVETRADWTAILQTHQSCAGGGFWQSTLGCGAAPGGSGFNCDGYGDCCTSCSGIRDADWAKHQKNTPWTINNYGTVWSGCDSGSYFGPCGKEDHCESGISTQALWDMATRDLPTLCGMEQNTAWQLMDRLFYSSMPQLGNMYNCTASPPSSNGCGGNTLYTLFRAIDDDGDGPSNGTPHAACIYQALARHNIACGNASDPANQNQTSCPSLTAPALSGTIGSNSNNLSWNSVSGATRYFIYRNETSCDSGFTKIGTVNAPSTNFTDTPLANGITYYYRIQAATSNDSCVSPMSNCISLTPQPCAGNMVLDKDIYNCADTVQVTLTDSTVSNPVQIEVWSTTDGTHKTITLTNNPPGSATYTGSFTTTTSSTPGPTQVRVSNGDTLYIRYIDPDYCGTPNVNVDLTRTIDCTGPVITNVHSENVMGTTADILWNTDELSDSTVIYGTTLPPSSGSAFVSNLVTNHDVKLTGLTECTNYYYYVKSKDAAGNESTNDNSGSFYTFTTGINVSPTYVSTDVPKAIPDPGTVTSVINVPDNKIIQKVIVTIENITHTYDADLDIYLIAPDGTRVELSTDNGSSGDNYINTVFDDEATTSITAGTPPFTGTFKPEGSLSTLIGKNAQGQWKLEVSDDYSIDSGTLNSWSLTLLYPPQGCGPSLEYHSSTFTDTCNGTGSGSGNGIIDAGEDILLQITLHNNGTAGTTGISATMSSTTPGVTITDNSATFPNIPTDGTGTSNPDHFSFKVDEGLTCGTTLNFNIHIVSNEGSWDDTFSLAVGQAIPGGQVTLFAENFSSITPPNLPAGWTKSKTSGNDWQTTTSYYCNAVGGIYYPYNYLQPADSWAYTPGLNLNAGITYTLNFNQKVYSSLYPEKMEVKCGLSNDPSGQTITIMPEQTFTNTTCTLRSYQFTVTANGTYYIGFHCTSAANMFHLIVDDITLTYNQVPSCNMNQCTGTGGCAADLGDPSENGNITALDASLTLQYITGLITFTPSQECKADTNGNSMITALDASYILQCAVGLCSSLPSSFQSSCGAHGNCP
ncbi:MAG: proprotein convertase P-domain-containing protein [Thermoanaerobaculia bacterium]